MRYLYTVNRLWLRTFLCPCGRIHEIARDAFRKAYAEHVTPIRCSCGQTYSITDYATAFRKRKRERFVDPPDYSD